MRLRFSAFSASCEDAAGSCPLRAAVVARSTLRSVAASGPQGRAPRSGWPSGRRRARRPECPWLGHRQGQSRGEARADTSWPEGTAGAMTWMCRDQIPQYESPKRTTSLRVGQSRARLFATAPARECWTSAGAGRESSPSRLAWQHSQTTELPLYSTRRYRRASGAHLPADQRCQRSDPLAAP